MSQRKKLEQVLEFLINEETEQAEELLHDIVVGKARTIYEGLVNDEEEVEDEVDEAFGGDVKDDFIGEVEVEKDEIEGDEIANGEADEYAPAGEGEAEGGDEFGFGGEEEELSTEEKVEELEVQLAELKAEFDTLMGQELEEPNHEPEDFGLEPEGEVEFGDEVAFGGEGEVDEMDYVSRLGEATKLQDPVADPGMGKEGKLAGTGKNSKIGAIGKESPYTHAPGKTINGAKAVDFTKGGEEKGGKGESAKDDTPSDNIGEEPKNFAHKEQKTEGDPVGTGKNTKKGAVNTKSPLSQAPKHP